MQLPIKKEQLMHPLIIGTFLLTAAGFLSRFIGFFYRVFLSRSFGAEGMGIYQLISPVLALSFALTVSGIQTAISKYVAKEISFDNKKTAYLYLLVGFCIAMLLSLACAFLIFNRSEYIAANLLLEKRTAPLLRIISLSIPMATVHSCINGYFYGLKKTGIPSACQLVEQVVRVSSVYIIDYLFRRKGIAPDIRFAVVGLVIGEAASMIISLLFIRNQAKATFGMMLRGHSRHDFSQVTCNLLKLAGPLSLNRVLINLLQSIEAICIPSCLLRYGYTSSMSLSVYGILTGMSLPLILFPSALTNSVSVLLLPMVSEAEATGQHHKIQLAIKKSIQYGFLAGLGCTLVFFFGGSFLGQLFYKNALAGNFIMVLSFLCPLMYIASTLNSILNGLGKTGQTFVFSIISLVVRLLFVWFLIPVYGIYAYLWGLLVSQFVQTILCLYASRQQESTIHI